MFDVWLDAGAKVVGESPLKDNETAYPYTRYLVEWPEDPRIDFHTREARTRDEQPKPVHNLPQSTT